jgi:hypothetical protein
MDKLQIMREVRDPLFLREGRGKIALLEAFQLSSARPSDRGPTNFQKIDM